MRTLRIAAAVALLCAAIATDSDRQAENLGRGITDSWIDFPLPLGITDFQNQSPFSIVEADDAHLIADGTGEVIAVIDGGLDDTHIGIDRNRIDHFWDYVDGDSDVSEAGDGIDQDDEDGPDSMLGHGTAVASILMQLAPEARFLYYRVMDEEGLATASAVADAILRAVDRGATVINICIAFDADNSDLAGAVSRAHQSGVIVVAGAGNDGSTVTAYPAAYPETIAVSSVNANDELLGLATNGPLVDILAPGEDVVVAGADLGDEYGLGDGTSFSTPFVAAAVALILEQDPSLGLDGVRDALQDNAVSIDLDPADVAAGKCGLRLDMEAAPP